VNFSHIPKFGIFGRDNLSGRLADFGRRVAKFCSYTTFPTLDSLLADLAWHVVKADFENTPNLGRPAKGMGPVGPTLARLGPGFVPRRHLMSYCLWLPMVLDIMKICMDFDPYDTFSSSDFPEMVNQQNLWNSLVISTYLLYLKWNVGMLAVNICILWPPIDVIRRHTPEVTFTINGNEHHMGYLSRWWYISLLASVHELCASSSIREASILLSEAIKVEKRCGVCFWPTKEEVQHTSHRRSVLLLAHSWVDHACLHYLAQLDHRWWVRRLLQWELSHCHFHRCSTCQLWGTS
jgi:hypothetical protein